MTMMNYATDPPTRRAFGKRPPAPINPKGKPGRPFAGARGGAVEGQAHGQAGACQRHGVGGFAVQFTII